MYSQGFTNEKTSKAWKDPCSDRTSSIMCNKPLVTTIRTEGVDNRDLFSNYPPPP